MRVAVLGASVSAQTRNHKTGEVTGYSEYLRLRLLDEALTTPEDFKLFTYPGNRASDGGLIRLQSVIDFRPDICLFEPLIEDASRGKRITDDQIAFFYASLIEAGILPVSVFLPIPTRRVPEGRPEFFQYNSFCKKHGLPVIRVDLTEIESIDDICKGVHTKPSGAIVYGEQIFQQLLSLTSPQEIFARLVGIPKVEDISVSIMQTVSENSPWNAGFEFIVTPKANFVRNATLVQLQKIGVFSPLLNVSYQAMDEGRSATIGAPVQEVISVWDSYCHYERASYVILANICLNGQNPVKVSVSRSNIDPDYARCRREITEWPVPAKRYLIPAGKAYLISDGPVEVGPVTRLESPTELDA